MHDAVTMDEKMSLAIWKIICVSRSRFGWKKLLLLCSPFISTFPFCLNSHYAFIISTWHITLTVMKVQPLLFLSPNACWLDRKKSNWGSRYTTIAYDRSDGHAYEDWLHGCCEEKRLHRQIEALRSPRHPSLLQSDAKLMKSMSGSSWKYWTSLLIFQLHTN